ncbi:MAG TPA: NAD(P)-binding protein [Gemmatimonadales bacterium]|nr:NAD(P)-binding protein [Gemmatimonadales bacterium]
MEIVATKVCILGAGPAGLAAAHELARHGVDDLVIVDRNPRPGGLARTVEYPGARFDVGPHRFFTKNAEVNALWHRSLGPDFLPVRRLTRIYHRGKLFRYPLEPADTLRNLGAAEAVQALVSYAAAQLQAAAVPANFEEWAVRSFGHKLYETFFKTYTEKIWGIPCAQIGPEWANQRIKGLDLRAVVAHALRRTRGHGPRSMVEEFDYPRLGAGMMYERIWEGIASPARRLLASATVTGIRHAGSRITAVELERHGRPVRVVADHFLSSLPLTRFFQMLAPAAPAALLRAASELYYREHITVNLAVEGAGLFPDQWIYIHEPGLRMARVANYNNFSPDMTASREVTALSVEYFAFQRDDLWRLADADLAALAVDEMEFAGLLPRGRPHRSWVVRETESYPTYFLGYREAFSRLKGAMARFANCAPIGRGGMYRYNNMDHSVYTGLLAARNYLAPQAPGYDVWAVNTDAEYHESGPRPLAAAG